MRSAYAFAVLWIFLGTASAMAQQQNTAAQPPEDGWAGPTVDWRHRQPTRAEIEGRVRAEGESKKAVQERNRQADQTIDELYKELMTPVPSRELSGQSGQLAR
jgi:hypothetical protein